MHPPIKDPIIGIIGGRGTLGQIFRAVFEEAGLEVVVSGRKPDGKKVLSNQALVKKADVVIVCVFLKDTAKVLGQIAPLLRSKQLFCDFTSLKADPIKIMLQSKAEVVGLHPMFGQVESVKGKNIFACPARSKKWWPWFKEVLEQAGLRVNEISPEKHDELAAIHQSTPHVLSIAFARLLEKRQIDPEKLFEMSSPSTQLELLTTGRLLAQDHEMYADIQILNPYALEMIQEFERCLGELSEAITHGNRSVLVKNLNSAARHFGKWKNFAFQRTNQLFQDFTTSKKISTPTVEFPEHQKEKIAILGPATQTELAAAEFLKKKQLKLSPLWCGNNTEVFEKVASGKAKIGFIPLENYTVGPVRETVKNLFALGGKVKIFAELSRPIAHALLGQKKLKAKVVQRIFAHPQARAQCQKFLQKNFPNVEIVETASTGDSVARALSDPNALAIGPVEATRNSPQRGPLSGQLATRNSNIEDDPNNRTRFVAISKKTSKNKSTRTALAFSFPTTKPVSSQQPSQSLPRIKSIFPASKVFQLKKSLANSSSLQNVKALTQHLRLRKPSRISAK